MDLYPAAGLPSVILNPHRAALMVTGHFGNWELLGHATGAIGFKTYGIARVLDNPYLEHYTRRLRQSTGQTLIAKKDDYNRLTQVLEAKAKVGTLADQDAGPRGVFVEFFGRPASTHKAIALMAIEFDAVMVVLGVPRVDRAQHPALPAMPGMESVYYAVEVEDLIDPRLRGPVRCRPGDHSAVHRGTRTPHPSPSGAVFLAAPALEASARSPAHESRAKGGIRRPNCAII